MTHPYFDDRRVVAWYGLAAGLAAAAETGRPVLVLLSRRSCGGSRALVEKTFPKEEIAEALASFVCIAADADVPDEVLAGLLAQAPRREPTPVCLYLSPVGAVVHSTVGGRPPAVFLRDLTEAQAHSGPLR